MTPLRGRGRPGGDDPPCAAPAGRRLQALRDRLDATDALPMAVHLPH